jgi:hypothetical protein
VDVSQGGTYPLDFRIAATSASGMDLFVDGEKKLTQNITNTGGWQVWQTLHNIISLESGKHKLRLVATSPGFNINWTEIGGIISGTPENKESGVIIYPNPAKDRINLANPGKATRIEIVDVAGHTVLQAPLAQTIDISLLPGGFYILKLISEKDEIAFHGAFIKRDE